MLISHGLLMVKQRHIPDTCRYTGRYMHWGQLNISWIYCSILRYLFGKRYLFFIFSVYFFNTLYIFSIFGLICPIFKKIPKKSSIFLHIFGVIHPILGGPLQYFGGFRTIFCNLSFRILQYFAIFVYIFN